MQLSTKKALIIGCGIAGPAVALFLKRAGLDTEVYEARSAAAEDAGFFLNLAPNGMNVLKTLGIDQRLEAEGFPATGISFFDRHGKQVGALDNSLDAQRYGARGLVVKRAKLQDVLRGEVERQGIPISFDKKLRDVDVIGEQGVVVHFDDGTSAKGDLLICCDGIHSRTRQLIFPESPKPSYLGMIDCGGFAYLPELRHLSGPQIMTFGKRAFFGYVVKPSGEVYWFSNVPWPKEPERNELSALSNEVWKERLLELHQDDPPAIPHIIRATPTDAMGKWPLRDLPALSTWHRGPVCVLGDAAHATSPAAGQGASMALEDAAVLGKCLRDLPDLERAFAAFQSMRQVRVEAVLQQARRNGSRKIPHPVMGWFRDLMLPFFLKSGAQEATRLYGYRVAWNEKVGEQERVSGHTRAASG